MRVYYGPPGALESEFVSYAASLQPGPARAVLVLCPSGRVAERLRRLLAEKTGFVGNVFFMTLGRLAEELDGETPLAKDPLLPGDDFHDFLLKKLLEKPGLDRYPAGRGFVSALKASLRDLGDSLADPDVLEEHLQTSADPVLQNEKAHLQWLINVSRAYRAQTGNVPGYRSYDEYFSSVLRAAQQSGWLASFHEILVYGFYELTGRQLELFHSLRSHYRLTAFWLYSSHPAFAFGRKFFEANILGAAEEARELAQDWESLAAGTAAENLFTAQSAPRTPPGLCVISAPNPEGEVFAAVKEMLRLHEQDGVPYEDMALTARSLDPYKLFLPDAFEQNAVPLNASFEFPLSSRPLGVFIINLFSLARGGFDRSDVAAVVSSPYFKRKNNWRYLIDASLAQRDFAQWTDLVRPDLPFYDPDFLPWMEDVKRKSEFLGKPLPWNELAQAAKKFLQDNTDQTAFSAGDLAVWDAVARSLEGFARRQAVAARAEEGEFPDELSAALQAVRLHRVSHISAGVSALDALNLRGLRFKAVFVLGMNEKSFPQIIREDPVLKDYYRRVLRDQLGFWLNQKAERFEEERLLFFCAVCAASSRTYFSFSHTDAEGKPLVPSGYLAELARAARLDLNGPDVRRVSGRMSERLKETDAVLLNAKEISLLLAARGAEASVFEREGLCSPEQTEALEAARRLSCGGELTDRDGMVGCGEEIFAAQNASGFSPSALQDLARCPMKYFLAKGVGLKEKDEILSRSELAADARGTAYHEILMDYYGHLYREGLAGALFDSALKERMERSVAARYDEKSYKRFGIYPVIWQLILQDIRDKLTDFAIEDARHLGAFVPSVFETQFEKIYSLPSAEKMKLKGIIDRIDVDASSGTFRVLDYKSGKRGGKDLAADMFKKVILQPFIYLILVQQQTQTRGLRPDGAALLSINKGYERQELSQEGFNSVKERADGFLELLMSLVRKGRFFISPGEHCQYCPYAAVCRKDAFRPLLRAKHSPQFRMLEEAKQ